MVGAGDAAGATTTSTSTTITISIETQISAAATATTLVAETAHRNNRAAAALEEDGEIPVGGTTHNIVGGRHIAIVRPLTGLAALHEATPLLTVRLVLDNSLAVKEAICPAIVLQVAGSATVPAADLELAIEQGAEERIASEAGISRAAVAETEMPSGEVPGVRKATTDRAHEPVAIAVLPAWDLEAAVASVVGAGVAAEGGAGKKATGSRT